MSEDCGQVDLLDEVQRLQEENKRLKERTYCAYCGYAVAIDDDVASAIASHILVCERHPMQTLAMEVERLTERCEDLSKANDSLLYQNQRLLERITTFEKWLEGKP